MPVRAIKKILSHKTISQGAICIRIPDVILNAFKVGSHHEFVCEVKRHFNKDKKLINEVNETSSFGSQSHILLPGRYLVMAETPLAQKYGLIEGDYIEILFVAVEEKKKAGLFSRKEDEIIRTEIFPERMIEDLDFNPD